ncbi:hypothetical protein [Mangrovimonas aestuarii]|uniref:hypothetical protein n=1 Tax=Mangrovimonas aestuarii TaxID=3018443 RepID=UPI0023797E0F|nr:hypothetical protein [Mangrovimonas aestuarii]
MILVCIASNGMSQTQKQLEREKNKVEIFSWEEKDNIQFWLHDQIQSMNLSDEVEEAYINVLITYRPKMRRLNDRDMGLSKDEIRTEFDALVKKMNIDISKLLTDEQFSEHMNMMDKLLEAIHRRMDEQ